MQFIREDNNIYNGRLNGIVGPNSADVATSFSKITGKYFKRISVSCLILCLLNLQFVMLHCMNGTSKFWISAQANYIRFTQLHFILHRFQTAVFLQCLQEFRRGLWFHNTVFL